MTVHPIHKEAAPFAAFTHPRNMEISPSRAAHPRGAIPTEQEGEAGNPLSSHAQNFFPWVR